VAKALISNNVNEARFGLRVVSALSNGTASKKVCIRVLPKHKRPDLASIQDSKSTCSWYLSNNTPRTVINSDWLVIDCACDQWAHPRCGKHLDFAKVCFSTRTNN
jgi:hypothetical protein